MTRLNMRGGIGVLSLPTGLTNRDESDEAGNSRFKALLFSSNSESQCKEKRRDCTCTWHHRLQGVTAEKVYKYPHHKVPLQA